MPAVSGTDEYVGTSVLDATQLAGVDVTALSNGDSAFLNSTKKFYYLDKSSAAAADGISVIATKSGIGRWIFGPVSNISVSTEAALALIGVTALTDGTTAFHTGELSTWILVTKALTAVAQQVVATPDPNRFWVRETTTHDVWVRLWIAGGLNIQTAANGGNDQSGTGTVGAPLASWTEAKRRIGAGPGGSVLLSTLTRLDVTVGTGVFDEILDLTGLRGAIFINGAEQTLTSGTLLTFTNINRTSTTGWASVSTAAFDFTPHLRRFLVITSGATTGARSIIESIPGANQAVITAPATQADLAAGTVVEVVPIGTEAFDIRIPATFFREVIADDRSPGLQSLTPSTTLIYSIAKLGFTSPGGAALRLRGRCRAASACKFDFKGDGVGGFSVTALQLQTDGFASFSTFISIIGFVGINDASTFFSNLSCHFSSVVLGTTPACTFNPAIDTMFSDCTIFSNGGIIILGNVLWNNVTASKHAVDTTASLNVSGRVTLQSTRNIYGRVNGATSDGFKLGPYVQVTANAVVAVLGVTGVAVRFGSTTKTFAELTPNGFLDVVVGAQTTGQNGSMWVP
jgi:hypothetical protein